VTLPPSWRRLAPLLLIVLVAVVAAACVPGGPGAGGSGAAPSATPHPPLEPAKPGTDPLSIIAWAFTPIFQTMFIIMMAVYQFLENLHAPFAIAWAIVVLTLVVRTVVIPLARRSLDVAGQEHFAAGLRRR